MNKSPPFYIKEIELLTGLVRSSGMTQTCQIE